MGTHNIGFYGDISKIISQSSSNKHLICSSVVAMVTHLFSLFSSRDDVLPTLSQLIESPVLLPETL